MKILITGVHGFVGSNLVRALKWEHEIYGLDIVSPETDGIINTFSWDAIDEIPDVDAVIHLAGKAHDTKNKADANVYFKVNTGLTQRIYDWFLASNAQKFIFFSSVKAAADTVEVSPLTEDIVPKPVGPYGESKIRAEEYIQSLWGRADKRTIILRPCMIHGPGNKGNLNLLYSVVSKGIPWPLGAFDNRRSFTSIDNLCFVISSLLSAHVETGIYNMADDESMSTNELIIGICDALDLKPRIWRLPKRFMASIASIGGALRLPLNTERLKKLTENYVVSNEKLKHAIGISQMPVCASQGLTKTINSFKNK